MHRKTPCEDRHIDGRPRNGAGRDGGDVATSQEMPRILSNHQKLGAQLCRQESVGQEVQLLDWH